jgi:hypothetical protein
LQLWFQISDPISGVFLVKKCINTTGGRSRDDSRLLL